MAISDNDFKARISQMRDDIKAAKKAVNAKCDCNTFLDKFKKVAETWKQTFKEDVLDIKPPHTAINRAAKMMQIRTSNDYERMQANAKCLSPVLKFPRRPI